MTAMMVVVVLFATSCEKERGGMYQGGNGASGKKLVKINHVSYRKTYVDYSLQHTSGSLEWDRMVWSGNQLVDVFAGGYENGYPIEESYAEQYVYDGDNLTEIRYSDGGYQYNYYLTYSGGHLTEIYNTYVDGSYSGWYRKTMTYSTDGHLQEVMSLSNEGYSYRYQFVWGGDNIVTVQCYCNGSLDYRENYTYDNKKSAYSEMPEWYALMRSDFEMLSANNVILWNRNDSDGDSYSTSYAYTYDGDYPVKCVRTDNDDYSSYYSQETYTTYYEYADGTKEQMPTIYSLTVDENNSSYGYATGGGEYAAGSTAVIYADAGNGGYFQQWSDGSTQNPRTLTVNGNASYVAQFSSNAGGGGGNSGTYRITFNGSSWYANATRFYDHTSDGYMTVYAYKNSADAGLQNPTNDVMVYGWLESFTGSYTYSDYSSYMVYRDPNQTFTVSSTRVLATGDTIAAGTYYRYNAIPSSFSETITAIDLNTLTISATWSEKLFDLENYINNNGNSYGTQYTLSGTLSSYHFSWYSAKGTPSASDRVDVPDTKGGKPQASRIRDRFGRHLSHRIHNNR